MLLFAKVVGVLGLFLGSWEDLRTREVPDWLSFGLIFLGVAGHLIFSVWENNYSYVLNSVAGLAVAVAFAYLMFYSAQWGGGDSKLLMGMGALIGLPVLNMQTVPLLLTFVLNIFIVGAVYGIFWSTGTAVLNWKKFRKAFAARAHNDKIVKVRKANLVLSAVLLAVAFFVSFRYQILLLGLVIMTYLTLYLWMFIKTVEECCMVKQVSVSDLVPGDWILEDVKVKGETVCSSEDLGVSEEQIEKLKKGKVEKVTVKEGIPFVPCFLLGYLALLAFGNWYVL